VKDAGASILALLRLPSGYQIEISGVFCLSAIFLEQNFAILGEVGEQRQAGTANFARPKSDGAFSDGERGQSLQVKAERGFACSLDQGLAYAGRKGAVDHYRAEVDDGYRADGRKSQALGGVGDPLIKQWTNLAPIAGVAPQGARVLTGSGQPVGKNIDRRTA